MKKKLALLLAAVMVAAMVPATAFAKTDNHVDKVAVVTKNTVLPVDGTAPELKIDDRAYGDVATNDQFYVTLEGAEWGTTIYAANVTATKMSSTVASFSYDGSGDITIDFGGVKVTGDEAKATIDANYSGVTAGTYTFAVTSTENATAKIAGTVTVPVEGDGVEIKDITISETVAGALKADGTVVCKVGTPGYVADTLPAKYIKVRLYGEFKFDVTDEFNVVGNNGLVATGAAYSADGKELYVSVNGGTAAASKLILSGIKVVPTKDTEAGDVAEIVISGAGIEKTTLEVATAVSYGMTFTAEDKKLPVFYAGRNADKATLKVTIKETAPETWWTARKATLTFPAGVELQNAAAYTMTTKNFTTAPAVTVEENVVTLTNGVIANNECGEVTMSFDLAFAPDFAGDVVVTLDGPAVPEALEATVAEVQYPVTFEVECADVSIDYRNVAVGDIVITETFAGALAKGDVLTLAVDKYIDLEDGVKFVVEEGDIKFDSSVTEDGELALTVTRESYKTPAVVRITNVKAYLDRALPAGDYELKLVLSEANEAYFQTYDAAKNVTGKFTTKSLELAEDYIKVVTAGRDQDDSTFTTSVAVTIGANTMTVGKAVVALDVPAYIANGYTMLPVRAVADALSGDAATVLWDGATQTVTIAFGARIIGMTIGSKVMNINGVAVAMSAAPEITNGRTFLPVRDLGYALGLTDADINWDDATKTATLN